MHTLKMLRIFTNSCLYPFYMDGKYQEWIHLPYFEILYKTYYSLFRHQHLLLCRVSW